MASSTSRCSVTTIVWPSGDHDGCDQWVASPTWKIETVPVATEYVYSEPPPASVKMIVCPSGDHAGPSTPLACVVTACGLEPSAPISQSCGFVPLSFTKAICDPSGAIVGCVLLPANVVSGVASKPGRSW